MIHLQQWRCLFFSCSFRCNIYGVQPEDLDDAADAEVDRVIEEITAGVLEPAGNAPSTNVVVDSKPSTAVFFKVLLTSMPCVYVLYRM